MTPDYATTRKPQTCQKTLPPAGYIEPDGTVNVPPRPPFKSDIITDLHPHTTSLKLTPLDFDDLKGRPAKAEPTVWYGVQPGTKNIKMSTGRRGEL